MSTRSPNPQQSDGAPDISLKPGSSPPPAWLLRTLSIVAMTFTILGFELTVDGLVRGTTVAMGDNQVPLYIPGLVLVLLGFRNLWSWHKMKQAIGDSNNA